MFERYSERARRALFSARYEAAQRGSVSIEPEHLVLGVLRENPGILMRFVPTSESVDTIRARLEAASVPAERISTGAEIPFSPACKDALLHTPFEADDLKNEAIRPEHIILGVLVKTDRTAARALRDAGIDPHAIREYLRGAPDDATDRPGAHSPPRVARQWTGVVKPGLGDQYVAHLRRETLAVLHETAGFAYATIIHRDVEDGIEFQVTTYWQSLDAIQAFAGDDVTRAVVPPAAQALMIRYDDRAVHYTIVQ
jgi:ATP-dependent Clp protease ATP-binding subunit ClpA